MLYYVVVIVDICASHEHGVDKLYEPPMLGRHY